MQSGFISLDELTFEQYEEIFGLSVIVWPPKEPVTAREKFDRLMNRDGGRPEGFSVVRDGEALLATAYVEERVIGTAKGDLPVMALGGVCSHPDARGRGFGAVAVRKVFEFVDDGKYPACLFQTSFKVEPFYLKLGGRRLTNRVCNSRSLAGLSPRAMRRQVFWDDVVMLYPAEFPLPDGDIDLNGPGY